MTSGEREAAYPHPFSFPLHLHRTARQRAPSLRALLQRLDLCCITPEGQRANGEAPCRLCRLLCAVLLSDFSRTLSGPPLAPNENLFLGSLLPTRGSWCSHGSRISQAADIGRVRQACTRLQLQVAPKNHFPSIAELHALGLRSRSFRPDQIEAPRSGGAHSRRRLSPISPTTLTCLQRYLQTLTCNTVRDSPRSLQFTQALCHSLYPTITDSGMVRNLVALHD